MLADLTAPKTGVAIKGQAANAKDTKNVSA
jgi:hypothetical protein